MNAALNTINAGAQSVAAGATIALGTDVAHFGRNCEGERIISLSGNGIGIVEPGTYLVDVAVVAAPTATGVVTVTLQNNGVTVQGATASGSVSTAGNPTTLAINRMIYIPCCSSSATLTLVLTGIASTVNNVSVSVLKI